MMKRDNSHIEGDFNLVTGKICFLKKICHLSVRSKIAIMITSTTYLILLHSSNAVESAPSRALHGSLMYWNPATAFAHYPPDHGHYFYPTIIPPRPYSRYGQPLPYKSRTRDEQLRKKQPKANRTKKKVIMDKTGQQMVKQLKMEIKEAKRMILRAYDIVDRLSDRLKNYTFSSPKCRECAKQEQSQQQVATQTKLTPAGSEEPIQDSSEGQKEIGEPQNDLGSKNSPEPDKSSSKDDPSEEETRLIEEEFSDDQSDSESDQLNEELIDENSSSIPDSNSARSQANDVNLANENSPVKARPDEAVNIPLQEPTKTFSMPPVKIQEIKKEKSKAPSEQQADGLPQRNTNEDSATNDYSLSKPGEHGSFAASNSATKSDELDQKRASNLVGSVDPQQTVVTSTNFQSALDAENGFPVFEGPKQRQGVYGGGGGQVKAGDNINSKPEGVAPFTFSAQRQAGADSMIDRRPSSSQPNYRRLRSHRSSYSYSSSGGKTARETAESIRSSLNKAKQSISKSPNVYGMMQKTRNHARSHMASAMDQARDALSLIEDRPFAEKMSNVDKVQASFRTCPHCGSHATATTTSLVSTPASSKAGAFAAATSMTNHPINPPSAAFPPIAKMEPLQPIPPMPPMPPMPPFPAMPMSSLQPLRPFSGNSNKRQKFDRGKSYFGDNAHHEVFEHDTGPIINVSPDGLSRHEQRHQSSGVISRDGSGSFKKSSSSFSSSSSSSSSLFGSSSSPYNSNF